MEARIWPSALARAESAASRAWVESVLVVTEPRSRVLTARKATAMISVTESMIRVMTRAMPDWREADARGARSGLGSLRKRMFIQKKGERSNWVPAG